MRLEMVRDEAVVIQSTWGYSVLYIIFGCGWQIACYTDLHEIMSPNSAQLLGFLTVLRIRCWTTWYVVKSSNLTRNGSGEFKWNSGHGLSLRPPFATEV